MFPLKKCLELTEQWLGVSGVWITTGGASPAALLSYEDKDLQNFRDVAIKPMLFIYGEGRRIEPAGLLFPRGVRRTMSYRPLI